MLKTLEKLIEQVKEMYSSWDVCDLMDNEILNWDFGYDEEEIDEYPSRWDFYADMANGEGEDEICNHILFTATGEDRNSLCDMEILEEFEEWLSDYSGVNFGQ